MLELEVTSLATLCVVSLKTAGFAPAASATQLSLPSAHTLLPQMKPSPVPNYSSGTIKVKNVIPDAVPDAHRPLRHSSPTTASP